MSKRILFVDDEAMLLLGLQRSLRSMRSEWEMAFVNGGAEALQLMEREPFDIIVTDMRMPAMNGAQLLEEVKRRFPQCFRIILSGQADQETIIRAVDPTHQYLSKPCDTNELKKRLMRAFAVRGLLNNPELQAIVSRLETLPSLPALYIEVTSELESREPSISRIAQLISQDMAMTAKMLQLVNSAFFGLRCRVSNPMQAVQLLGLDTLRALVLSTHVFDKFQTEILGEPETSYLWKHSFSVAKFAKSIATFERTDRQTIDDCFTSGLLHDSGKLILSSAMGKQYGGVLELVKRTGRRLVDAEKEVLGYSHAEVAAYLLGLWGLPEGVIEGVAQHHNPLVCDEKGFNPVVGTHVAVFLHEEQTPFWLQDGTTLNREYLAKQGYEGREEIWRKVVQEEDRAADPATAQNSLSRSSAQ
jgi:HD-like signal output (HDOD) protein